MRSTLMILPALAIAMGACAESSAPPAPSAARLVWPSSPGSSVYWNGVARGLVAKYNANAFVAIRGYAILSLAQYNAVVAAEREGPGPKPSVRAAVSRASAAALAYVFPAEAQALDVLADGFVSAATHPGEDAAAGDAIGQSAADAVVARAMNDRFFAPWTGTVPTGPGKWFSATPPAGAMIGHAEPFFLDAGDQFRPPPPPAYGSQAYLDALAEVRQISDTRTPAQIASARFWALPAGTYQPPGYWNDEASKLIVQYDLRERRATHLLALMNMTSFDAIIASHDAKFAYWLLRPAMADPAITLAVGMPNFPSYPSNHATISSAMAMILARQFPAESERLEALAAEAAMSRLLGGIHYRFDNEAGLALGKQVAAWALAHDVVGNKPFPLD